MNPPKCCLGSCSAGSDLPREKYTNWRLEILALDDRFVS
jgi:hypothetical protein